MAHGSSVSSDTNVTRRLAKAQCNAWGAEGPCSSKCLRLLPPCSVICFWLRAPVADRRQACSLRICRFITHLQYFLRFSGILEIAQRSASLYELQSEHAWNYRYEGLDGQYSQIDRSGWKQRAGHSGELEFSRRLDRIVGCESISFGGLHCVTPVYSQDPDSLSPRTPSRTTPLQLSIAAPRLQCRSPSVSFLLLCLRLLLQKARPGRERRK